MGGERQRGGEDPTRIFVSCVQLPAWLSPSAQPLSTAPVPVYIAARDATTHSTEVVAATVYTTVVAIRVAEWGRNRRAEY